MSLRWTALVPLLVGLVIVGGFATHPAYAQEEEAGSVAEAVEEAGSAVESALAAPEEEEGFIPEGEEIAAYAIDNLTMFICAVLVLFMQAGFAMVEAGFSPAKHTVNILFKNALDICVGVLLYFFVGYNLMYPGTMGEDWNGYIAVPSIATSITTEGAADYLPTGSVDWLFQVAFAATAATIVSGAVAGRMKFGSYLIYSALLTGLIYPISGSWKWGLGWLDAMGFYDFAGSCIVHAVGGFAGLAGAIVLGPRLGRYSADGKPIAIPGHSLPLATLGVFILLIGWFGFNPGSVLAMYGKSSTELVMLVAVNTLLGAAAGGVVSTFIAWGLFGKPDLSMALNGILGGLVGVTANCDGVSNLVAIIIGAVAGALVVAGVLMLDKLKIDDPVGAWPVHGLCGIWGCLAIGIFPTTYDEGVGTIGAQLTGIVAYCGWAFVTMLILFSILKAIGFLRVTAEEEEKGLDISEHGMTAYAS
ncbi:ammonium transporter [Stratiformator vulcanicus]|uniref:ammonium transporter n=1 Tax=Stratiformator vulcanicus TaxID=2527980 RepID=UPI00119F405F|nr:ammonium transporter [Stratiformator vulcanicus]